MVALFITHGRKIERDEAPKVLAPPPTANLAEWNFVLKVVVNDQGEYKWRHQRDF